MPIKQATRRLKKIKIGLNKPQKESEKNLQLINKQVTCKWKHSREH